MSKGQAITMMAYGYEPPIYITGWHWCDQMPFQPFTKERKLNVLYAPIHALNNGFIYHEIKELNALIFEQLCTKPINLVVRHVGSMESCGIEMVNDVVYHPAHVYNQIDDIDHADVVISFGTFGYMAVARGKPTLFYRQDIPYFDGHSEESILFAENWDDYGDYMRFPYDYPENSFMDAMDDPVKWKNTFIGPQITPEIIKGIF